MREMKQEMMSHRQPTYSSNCPPNRVAQPAAQYHGPKATDQSRCQERTEHCQQPKRCPEGNYDNNFRREDRSDRRCFICGNPGHVAWQCRKPSYTTKPEEKGVKGTTNNRTDAVGRDKWNPPVPGRKKPNVMQGIEKPIQFRREAYLEVVFQGRTIHALLDSGCEQSVIGKNLIPRMLLSRTDHQLSAANGSPLPLLGETVIEFEVSGFKTGAHVVVTRAVTDLILGIEWLQQNNCAWNFGLNTFSIQGHLGVLKCKKATRNEVRKLICDEDTEVLAQQQTHVPVVLTCPGLNVTGDWLIDNKVFNNTLVVASTVYSSETIKTICRVVNLSDTSQLFRRGDYISEAVWVDKIWSMDQPMNESDNQPLDLRHVTLSNERSDDMESEGEEVMTNSDQPDQDEFIDELMTKVSIDLTDEQRKKLRNLLEDKKSAFSLSDFDLGRTDIVQHKIDTGDARPFRQPLRRHPMAHLPVIDEHVEQMLQNDICVPSTSPWASNVVLVTKSDGSVRFCIDYRQLNSLTVKDSYPLPRIDTCFDALGGTKYFSTLDLRQGYWQVENDPATADKTTFITRKGAFKFKVFPFGLSNAPAIFQRLMNLVMMGLTWEACLVFLDDIVVISKTFDQHIERLGAVLDRLILANLKLKPSKCKLLQEKVKFLGSMVSADGIEPDPDKIQAIVDWPQPKNLTELRAFVGLANYYRRHIEGFSNIAKPLSDLTKKNRPFLWGDDQQQAFETLKNRLVNYPVLAPPIEDGKYIVDTDASNFAMGAVLQQEQNGVNRVIAYASKTFDAAQVHYCTTRKELAAVIFALKEFRHYLLGGKRFLLRTDHGALTSLFKVPIPIQQQARYLNILADYNFEIQHRPGTQHGNSDGLSRRPCRNKRCNREDCEEFDPDVDRQYRRLRSGKNYLKGVETTSQIR